MRSPEELGGSPEHLGQDPATWRGGASRRRSGPGSRLRGGAGGIRTLEGVAPLRHFQCRALGQLGDRSRSHGFYGAGGRESACVPIGA